VPWPRVPLSPRDRRHFLEAVLSDLSLSNRPVPLVTCPLHGATVDYSPFFGWKPFGVYPEVAGLGACFKIPRGAVFAENPEWRGATKENIPGGSSTEKQRSQAVCSAKTLRAAGLSPGAGVGSAVTAHIGDAPALPPWPQPKSLAAAPLAILKHALRREVAWFGSLGGRRICRLLRMIIGVRF
jgi:hypothetical protein